MTQPAGEANRGLGTTVNGRVRALDTIPFDESFDFDMELLNNRGGDYAFEVATMFYAKPGALTLSHLLLGDLDLSGTVDEGDWEIFRNDLDIDINGEEIDLDLADLSVREAYLSGDLDFDADVDLQDFQLFATSYISANGQEAFEALFVPEPGSMVLIGLSSLALIARRRKA